MMKKAGYPKREEGMALVTVLLLGLFGAAIVVGFFYITKNLVTMSGIGSRYVTELEEANGIANYIAGTVMSSTRDLGCGSDGASICIPQATINCNATSSSHIYIPQDIYDSQKYQVNACYLFSVEDPDAVVPYTMYGFWLRVLNSTTGEKVDIDFVYRVE